MSRSKYPADLDPILASIIHRKAGRLGRRAVLLGDDFEDVLQDCRAFVLSKLHSYNPARPLAPFVTTLVCRFLANRDRHRFAAKRDARRTRQRGDHDVPDPRIQGRRPHWQEDVDRRLDIAEAVRALEPELRELARRLSHQSVAEIARETGVPRSTVQSRVRRIRERFERRDLADFL